jgi:DNA-binding response OmpR family regulator
VVELTVLIIEDEETTRALLRRAFERTGARVVEAGDGREGMRTVYSDKPDVVLLDVEMPGIDGFDALARIRELTNVPVMMVTSHAGRDEKLRAFDTGADDYVVKPFDIEEVVARTRALARRHTGTSGDENGAGGDRYIDEHLNIDFAAVEARVGHGDPLQLTPLQFRLLSTFVRHPNEVLTPEQLLELAWGSVAYSPERVKVHVANLRRKLTEAGAPPDAIETVRGFGYRYRPR